MPLPNLSAHALGGAALSQAQQTAPSARTTPLTLVFGVARFEYFADHAQDARICSSARPGRS
jgi:hypothetical protein